MNLVRVQNGYSNVSGIVRYGISKVLFSSFWLPQQKMAECTGQEKDWYLCGGRRKGSESHCDQCEIDRSCISEGSYMCELSLNL